MTYQNYIHKIFDIEYNIYCVSKQSKLKVRPTLFESTYKSRNQPYSLVFVILTVFLIYNKASLRVLLSVLTKTDTASLNQFKGTDKKSSMSQICQIKIWFVVKN